MYLLDTDTLIYALKGVPEVVRNFQAHAADPKAISVMSYGELLYGAGKSARPVENTARVRRAVELIPVIDVSRAVMETFASLKAELDKKGKPVDDFDLVIGATALVLNYRLVTNDERHFRAIPGLKIENWTKS